MASPRKRMFRPGELLTVQQAVERVLAGDYIFCRRKPLHAGWVQSWPLHLLIMEAKRGVLREAIRNPASEPTKED